MGGVENTLEDTLRKVVPGVKVSFNFVDDREAYLLRVTDNTDWEYIRLLQDSEDLNNKFLIECILHSRMYHKLLKDTGYGGC